MSDRVVVTVPGLFADLLPSYLEQRRAALTDWRRYLDEGRFEELRRAAHRVRGSGGSYGVRPLSEAAGRLEAAATAGDAEACRQGIAEIAHLLERLEIRFE